MAIGYYSKELPSNHLHNLEIAIIFIVSTLYRRILSKYEIGFLQDFCHLQNCWSIFFSNYLPIMKCLILSVYNFFYINPDWFSCIFFLSLSFYPNPVAPSQHSTWLHVWQINRIDFQLGLHHSTLIEIRYGRKHATTKGEKMFI